MRDREKTASTRIQAAKSNHKSIEARLKTAEHQMKELTAKLDREINRACKLRAENKKLKAKVDNAWAGVQKAEDTAQSYYDQGFEKVVESLKSQLAEECNKCFLQGWCSALNQAGVDDTSKLYNLGPKHQTFKVGLPKEHEEEEATGGLRDPEVDEVLRDPEVA